MLNDEIRFVACAHSIFLILKGMTEQATEFYKLFIGWTNENIKHTFVERYEVSSFKKIVFPVLNVGGNYDDDDDYYF